MHQCLLRALLVSRGLPTRARAALLWVAVAALGWGPSCWGQDAGSPAALEVVLSQAAFHPAGLKDAVVRCQRPFTGSFQVTNAGGRAVARGRLLGSRRDVWGWYNALADFSSLSRPGRYRLRVTASGAEASGMEASTDFTVSSTTYVDILDAARKWWYVQRCGMAVPGWHGPCHLDDGAIRDLSQASFGTVLRRMDATGGWHDAGDLNKWSHYAGYGVWSLSEVQRLLAPSWRGLKSDLPDLLDEARWGARYLLRLQKPDGSFYTGPVTWRPAKDEKDVWSNGNWNYWGPPDGETDGKRGTGDERVINLPEGTNTPRLMLRNGMALALFAQALFEHSSGAPKSTAAKDGPAELPLLAKQCLEAAAKVRHFALSGPWERAEAVDYAAAALEIEMVFDRLAVPPGGRFDAKTAGREESSRYWRAHALRHARQILALQHPEGWFRVRAGADDPYSDYFHSPGHFVAALIHYAQRYPKSSEMSAIRRAVERYMRHQEVVSRGFPFGQMRQYGRGPDLLEIPSMPQGSTPYLSGSAYVQALAGRWLRRPEWVRMAERQIQWTLGRNPLGLSLLVGVGRKFPGTYHTRYATLKGHEDGVIPGGVLNGINGGDGAEQPLNAPVLDTTTRGVSPAWQTNEYWTVNQGWFMLGVLEVEQALREAGVRKSGAGAR